MPAPACVRLPRTTEMEFPSLQLQSCCHLSLDGGITFHLFSVSTQTDTQRQRQPIELKISSNHAHPTKALNQSQVEKSTLEMTSCSITGLDWFILSVEVWRSGSSLVSIDEVNLHRARLVLGWVTVSGFNSRCGTFISVCNQPLRSTQPGHPFVGIGEMNTSQRSMTPCGWGVKTGMVRVLVAGKTA